MSPTKPKLLFERKWDSKSIQGSPEAISAVTCHSKCTAGTKEFIKDDSI